jgi:hypothetical protein
VWWSRESKVRSSGAGRVKLGTVEQGVESGKVGQERRSVFMR